MRIARRRCRSPIRRARAVRDRLPGSDGRGDGIDELRGQLVVATEVARRTAGLDAQPPWLDHLQARRELPDRPHHGLEHPGIAVGIVVEEHRTGQRCWATRRRCPIATPSAARSRRAGDHAVGLEHDGGGTGGTSGDDRPVRPPHGEHAMPAAHAIIPSRRPHVRQGHLPVGTRQPQRRRAAAAACGAPTT